MATPAEGLKQLLAAFDRLEIRYAIGGSIASSIYGLARPTMDCDIVAEVRAEHLGELAAELAGEFYADAVMMLENLGRGRPFNLIHLPSAFKFDIFPLRRDAYSLRQMERRRYAAARALGPEAVECAVASPEDVLLNKLRWYRLGGERSERQWQDALGILEVQGERLDRGYLAEWSAELGVADLLERLYGAVRGGGPPP